MRNYLKHLFVFVLFLLAASFFWGAVVFPYFGSGYMGYSSDPISQLWFLYWWKHVLITHQGFLHSDFVFFPVGINLTYVTNLLGLFLLSFPLFFIFKPLVVYNLLVLFSPILTAFFAYLYFRYLTRDFWPAVLGGFLFGFSSYMIGQMLAHLNLAAVFLIPLIFLMFEKQIRSDISKKRFIFYMIFLMLFQFLINNETAFVLGAVFSLFLFLRFLLIKEERKSIWRGCLLSLIALCVVALILTPYFWVFMHGGKTTFQKVAAWNSIDIANIFVPTNTNLLGGTLRLYIVKIFSISPLYNIRHFFTASLIESGGYLGLPLLIILVSSLFSKKIGRLKVVSFSLVVFLLFCSFGPYFQWFGRSIGSNILGKILEKAPVFHFVMPSRYMLFVSFFAIIPVVLWFAKSRISRITKMILAGVLVFVMIPNPNPSLHFLVKETRWLTPINKPSFIDKMSKSLLAGKTVLMLPYIGSDRCHAMYYQVANHYKFKLTDGCAGYTPEAFHAPLLPFLKSYNASRVAAPLPNFFNPPFLKFIRSHHVGAIIINKVYYPRWENQLTLLKAKRIESKHHYLFMLSDKN